MPSSQPHPLYGSMPALIFLMSLVGLAIGAVGLQYVQDRLVATTGESLALAASDIADMLDRLLFERYSDIPMMARAKVFQERDPVAMTEYLEWMKKHYSVYRWLGVADAQGRIIAATNPASVGKDISRSYLFQTIRDRREVHVQDVEVSEDAGGIPVVAFAGPIVSREKKFLGVVISNVGLHGLEDVSTATVRTFQLQRGESGKIEYQFLTRDGDLIVDSVLRQEGKVNLRELVVVSALFAGSAQPGYVEEMHMRRHVPVVTGYAQAEGYGPFSGLHWGVLVRMDRSDILAPIWAVQWKLGLTAALLVLPMIGFLLWASRRLQREWAAGQEENARAMAAERAAREGEERYRLVAETATDAILTIDSKSRILFANRAAENIFGYSLHEMQEQPLTMLMPERLRPVHTASLKRYLETGQKHIAWEAVELTGLHKTGKEIPLEVSFGEFIKDGQHYFTGILRDITERKRAEKALHETEERFRLTIDHANDAIFFLDTMGVIQWANHRAQVVTGRSMDEMVGRPIMASLSPQAAALAEARLAAVRRGESVPPQVEFEVVRPDGRSVWLELNITSVKEGGKVIGRFLVGRDLTERRLAEEKLRQAEENLRQSQKMEAIGKLAGGIAHDFNNLLTALMGYSELLLGHFQPGDPGRKNAEEIRKAAGRAASLTHQLLAFSRRQVLVPKVLNLNAVLTNLEPMLRRLIGEDIELEIVPCPALDHVQADPGQIEQIILNLVVNARDAMPQGGKLTIETANVELDETYRSLHIGITPGPHVMLAVSDTGCGMDEETQSRIFEPFFTTKEQGKGTGLGLSTVFGIVKQSGGDIWVYSEPGRGATFKIYLPRIEAAPRTVEPELVHSKLVSGKETVILVEDDEGLRELVETVLAENGYTVLVAHSIEEAFQINGRREGRIDLMVTDVVMPRMSGRELAERLQSARPSMKVLYMSGYTDDAIVRHGVLTESMAFLQKPFTPVILLQKVRDVLDGSTKRSMA